MKLHAYARALLQMPSSPDLPSAGKLVALSFETGHLSWRFSEAPIELRCTSQCLP
jgi:hypothetical protein